MELPECVWTSQEREGTHDQYKLLIMLLGINRKSYFSIVKQHTILYMYAFVKRNSIAGSSTQQRLLSCSGSRRRCALSVTSPH